MNRLFCTIAFVVASVIGAAAQTTSYGGEIIGAANMKHTDAINLSQTENSFMSARVSAMGGAFASLGADLSSMSINPAGLGMYRSSALSISGNFTNSSFSNNMFGGVDKDKSFSFNQIGLALNLYQGAGSLASFTFGFAYNKLADLNYYNVYDLNTSNVSIAEFFAEQMWGVPDTMIGTDCDPFRNPDINVDEWGGVLAYQTYLIDPVVGADGTTSYVVSGLPLDMLVSPWFYNTSEGSVGEYTFSGGMNFGNYLYLGATIGIQDIAQSLYYHYSELYSPQSTDGNILNRMSFNSCVNTYGSGINFKVGAILRPIPSLRLGVAYHSATLVEVLRDYSTNMLTKFGNDDKYSEASLVNSNSVDYSSPNKLLLGASWQLGERALVSVDYDFVWYKNTNFHTGYAYVDDVLDAAVDADCATSHNFRLGAELRPLNQLYLRGGYAFYGSPFGSEVQKAIDNGDPFYGCYKTSTQNYSLGVGWRFAGGASLDFAWTNSTAKYTNYLLYQYYTTNVAAGSDPILVQSQQVSNNQLTRNSYIITYSVPF